MSWVWKNGPHEALERLVLLKLADNANQDGKCWPSLPEIALATCLSESTVRRSVQSLEKGGWLEVNRGVGRGKSSNYTLIEKVSEGNLLKGVTQKGFPQKGFCGTEKGVPQQKPPTPPLIEEPSRTIKNSPREWIEVWNSLCASLPKVEKLQKSRQGKILARIAQGVTLEVFRKAVECCATKPFLRGDNDRGWTATFDWLVSNDVNIEKAINNLYGSHNGVGKHNPLDGVKFAKLEDFVNK